MIWNNDDDVNDDDINNKKEEEKEQYYYSVSVVVVVVVVVVVLCTQISPPKEANCLQRDYPEKKIDVALSLTSHRNTSAPYYPFKTIVSHPIISIVASKPLHRPSNFDE